MNAGPGICRWVILLLCWGDCFADTILLTNGRTLEGVVTGQDEKRIQFEQHGIKLWLNRSTIQSLQLATPDERGKLLTGLHAPKTHEALYYPEPARATFDRLRELDALRKESLAAMENVKAAERGMKAQSVRVKTLQKERTALVQEMEKARETLNAYKKSEVNAYNDMVGKSNRLSLAQDQALELHDRQKREKERSLKRSMELLSAYDRACREAGTGWWVFLKEHPPEALSRGDWFRLLSDRLNQHPAHTYVRDPLEVSITEPEAGKTRIRVSADERGHFMIPVTLNGTTGSVLMLDTGASVTMISTETARAANVEAVGKPVHATVADGRVVQVIPGVLRQLHICGVLFTNEPVGIMQGVQDDEIQGLLGMSLLRQIKLDVSKDTLWMDLSAGSKTEP